MSARHTIENVGFVDQTEGTCGPATLTMAMNKIGSSVSVQKIMSEVYDQKMKGTLQSDMIRVARREGLMAVELHGLSELLDEIADDHAVIIFENLALSWVTRWHYALVYGFDLPAHQVILHSGHEAGKKWDLRRFERSWSLGDYWGLVVLRPGQIARSAGELRNATSAAALEELGHEDAAAETYFKILQVWPDSLPALIGLGNVNYVKGAYGTSIQYLETAAKVYPDSAVVWHNLAVAEGTNKNEVRAREDAAKAMSLASPNERSQFLVDLQKWLADSN